MSLEKPLAGKVGIVTGVANKRSIAFGIAKAWHEAGAKLIFNYQGERLKDGVIKLVKESFGEDTPVCDLDVMNDQSIADSRMSFNCRRNSAKRVRSIFTSACSS